MKTGNVILAAVAVSVALAVAGAQGAELKMGVIDMSKLMKAFNETKSAESFLEKQIEEFEAEQKDMIADRDKLRKDFESARESAKDKALNEKERESRMDKAEEKLNGLRECEMKIRARIDQRQKEIAEQKSRMQRRIVGKLRDIVSKYAAEKKYAMILDSASLGLSGVESVVYSQESLDVTDDLLKIVNIGIPEHAPVPEKAMKSDKPAATEKPAK